ncbi:Phosphoserine phosphatase, chloroplastic [Hordeum vulgare]|nr:Phosphoserine phosphatase, chloroplastic [Hordeum vulgare]
MLCPVLPPSEAGVYGMASPIGVRTSARHTLSVSPLSSVRSPQTSQLAMRTTNPLFPCTKLSQARAVVAAAMEVTKHPSSSCFANRQPSKEVLETWRSANAVCFDVDSTVCLDEGIDELADFCGAGQAVAEWTTKAMTGTVPFEEALAARISLIKPSLSQVQDCLEKRPPRISPGIADLIKTLLANNTEVFLVSGGFRQMIEPVAFELGIPTENIIANRLLFGTSGEYAGFDTTEPTSRSGGKAVAVQQIRQDRGYKTLVMIGDGATDLEVTMTSDAHSSAVVSSAAAIVVGFLPPNLAALLAGTNNVHNSLVVTTMAGPSSLGTNLGSFMAGLMPLASSPTPAAAAVRPTLVLLPAVADMPAPAPLHFTHVLIIKLSLENFIY